MDQFFLGLLNRAFLSSVLILAVIFVRALIKKAPKWITCALWIAVAVRLIVPFQMESVFSLLPSSDPIPSDIVYQEVPQITSGAEIVDQVINPVLEDHFTADPTVSVNPMQVAVFVAARLWLLGVIALCFYMGISYFMLRRKVAASQKRSANVYVCDEISSPFILGILRPRIYLPSGLEADTMECVLAHEKAHLKRRDHIWKPLGFCILTIYWFHLLCWIAYILLCKDIELACDEKVTKDKDQAWKAGYCQALLDCNRNRRLIAACPVAFGEVGVKERVKTVLNYRKPAFWMSAAAVVLSIAVVVCFMTNSKNDPSAPEKENVKEISAEAPEAEAAGEEEQKDVAQKAPDEGKITQKEENPLEAAITAALMENYDPDTLDGLLRVESHVILSNEVKNDADGNPMEETVYLLALLRKYQMYDKAILVIGESYVPTAITFSVNGSEGYVLKEYWTPRDGSYYVEDVLEKFPQSAAEDALHEDRYISELQSESYQKALDGFFAKGSLKERIGELLETISSSAGEASAAADPIEAHPQEYKELLEYEECSLRYCFEEFLKGGQTDLRGKIMEQLCMDIMGSWGIAHHDVAYDTGQDWFEGFYENVMKLAEQYDDETLEKNYPAAWILLELIRETDYPKEAFRKL